MKKILILAIFIVFVSCKKESLQNYLLDKKENPDFVTFDFPANILPFSLNEKATIEDKKAIESVKKINIAFLSAKNVKKNTLLIEKQKLETILANSNYKTLMKLKDKRGQINLYFSGDTDAINELVGFVYSDDFGTGIARLLGENMTPDALIKMISKLNIDKDSEKIKRLKEIIENNVSESK